MADFNTSTPNSSDVRGRVWSDDEVSMLLDIWSSEEIMSKFDGTVRNTAVFGTIANQLGEAGFERSVKEVRNKIKNMKRSYKKARATNMRSGAGRTEVPFQEKMDLILGDRPCIQPVVTFQSASLSPDLEELESADNSLEGSQCEYDDDENDDDDDDTDKTNEQEEGDGDFDDSILREIPAYDLLSQPREHEERQAQPSISTQATPQQNKRRDNLQDTPAAPKPQKQRINPKTSRMRETISVVAEAFQVQAERAEHAYREECRKQQKERKDFEERWQTQMLEDQKNFNDTMKSFMTMIAGSISGQQAVHPPTAPATQVPIPTRPIVHPTNTMPMVPRATGQSFPSWGNSHSHVMQQDGMHPGYLYQHQPRQNNSDTQEGYSSSYTSL